MQPSKDPTPEPGASDLPLPEKVISRWCAAVVVWALIVLPAACGGSSSPTAPPTTSGPTITLLMVHSRGAWLRPADSEDVTANAQWSDQANRGLTSVTWTSSDAMVFTITPSGGAVTSARLTAIGPGQATLTASSQGVTQTVPVRVAEVAVPPGSGPSEPAAVVLITEFRFEGPGGEHDEFIELKNVGGATADISGWAIAFSDLSGNAQPLGNFPQGTSLGSGCHYLMVSGNPRTASGEPAVGGDFVWSPPLASGGGIALHDSAGRIRDQAGMGGRYGEGRRLEARTFTSSGSFQRVGESNDNRADFVATSPTTRSNAASPCG